MRQVVCSLLIFTSAFLSIPARAGEGAAADVGAAVESIAKLAFPDGDAKILGSAATLGTATYVVLNLRKASVTESMNALREFKEIGFNEMQLNALKRGDRLIFYSADLDDLSKVVGNVSKADGPFLMKLVNSDNVWRLNANGLFNRGSAETTRAEFTLQNFNRGNPVGRQIELFARELNGNTAVASELSPLSKEFAQSTARLSVRVGEEHPMMLGLSRELTALKFAKRATPILVLGVLAYEAYRLAVDSDRLKAKAPLENARAKSDNLPADHSGQRAIPDTPLLQADLDNLDIKLHTKVFVLTEPTATNLQ